MLHAVLLLSSLIPASVDTCTKDPAEIRIYAKIDPPVTDLSKTEAQLDAMKTDPIAGSPRFTHVGGLTVGSISVDSEIRIANTRFGDGQICAWPSVVTITLGTKPTVYVAVDYSKCRIEGALAHEMQHVAIDRDIINRHSADFRRQISAMVDAIGVVGPAPDTALSSIRHRIEDKINAAIAVAVDDLNDDRATRQSQLDSPAEYQRLSLLCPQIDLQPRSRLSGPKSTPPAAH